MPFMARSSEAGSRKSPVTYSRDKSAIARLVLEARRSTRTSSPRATNCRATWLPRKPAAPVTSVVMRFLRPLRPREIPVRGGRLFLRWFVPRFDGCSATAQQSAKKIPTICSLSAFALPRFFDAKPRCPDSRYSIRHLQMLLRFRRHREAAQSELARQSLRVQSPGEFARAHKSKSQRAEPRGFPPRLIRTRPPGFYSAHGSSQQVRAERLERAAAQAETHECAGEQAFHRFRERQSAQSALWLEPD